MGDRPLPKEFIFWRGVRVQIHWMKPPSKGRGARGSVCGGARGGASCAVLEAMSSKQIKKLSEVILELHPRKESKELSDVSATEFSLARPIVQLVA